MKTVVLRNSYGKICFSLYGYKWRDYIMDQVEIQKLYYYYDLV